MINYIEILWGMILTFISSMILGYLLGALGSFVAFFIVASYIGYLVNEDIVNGALHGSIVSVLAGILSFLVMMFMWGFGIGPGATIMEFGVMGIIMGLSVDLIVGAIGGSVGSIIRQ